MADAGIRQHGQVGIGQGRAAWMVVVDRIGVVVVQGVCALKADASRLPVRSSVNDLAGLVVHNGDVFVPGVTASQHHPIRRRRMTARWGRGEVVNEILPTAGKPAGDARHWQCRLRCLGAGEQALVGWLLV